MKVVHEIGGGSGCRYIYCASILLMERGFHLLSCIKRKTCIKDGCKVVQLLQCMHGISELGWMDSDNFLAWIKYFCHLYHI